MRLAVLASGSGSICDAMLCAGVGVELVVVDRTCGAIEVAASHGVAALHHERTSFGADFDRDAYTGQLVQLLQEQNIDLVIMAGWGTILGQPMFDAYAGHILNTHPALLPSFPGWHGVEDAVAYGVKVTGCTVHVATLEVDAGPILAQEAVPVLDDDTTDSLHERIKAVERRLYVDTVDRLVADPSILERARPPQVRRPPA
jgi:phosphoribosylglycinamide formyltransferase-1